MKKCSKKETQRIAPADYVIANFATKKTLKCYVGLIQEKVIDGDYVFKFLRKGRKSAFHWPEVNVAHYNKSNMLFSLSRRIRITGKFF